MTTIAELRILLGMDASEVARAAADVRGDMGDVAQSAHEAKQALGLVGDTPIDVQVDTSELEAARADAELAAADIQASMDESAQASGAGFESFMGSSFDKIKAKFAKGIVMGVTAAGIAEIQERFEELQRIARDITFAPPGAERDAALLAEIDKQIEAVSGALIQIPGQLQGLKDARQAILDLAHARDDATAAGRAFIGREHDVENAAEAAALATLAAAAAAERADEVMTTGFTSASDAAVQLAKDISGIAEELVGLPFLARTAQDAFDMMGGGTASGGPGLTAGELYIRQLQDAAAARDAEAREAAADAADARRDAELAAADAKRAGQEAARQSERDAADAQQAKQEMWRSAQQAADQYFDRVHQENMDAIDDIRDRRNAELDAQRDLIQGAVSAERERLDAMRDAEREQGLRSAVATAESPEDLAAAQQDLQRFLEDQRVDFLQSQADAQVAALEVAQANADAAADLALAAEANRDAAARAMFDPRVRFSEGGTVASVTTGDFLSDAPLVIQLFIDGEQITEVVDRRQDARRRAISPTSVSTGSSR